MGWVAEHPSHFTYASKDSQGRDLFVEGICDTLQTNSLAKGNISWKQKYVPFPPLRMISSRQENQGKKLKFKESSVVFIH